MTAITVTFAAVYGVCRHCGCTDDHFCPQGCFWVDPSHTLCSACFPSLVSAEPAPGTCRFCGVTEGGDGLATTPAWLWWIDKEHTACSRQACLDKYFAEYGARVKTMIAAIAAEHCLQGSGVRGAQ